MNYTAYIDKDIASRLFIGYVPSLTGAHTCAATIDDLNEKLKEVILLCLDDINDEDIKSLPVFAGIFQIEISV